MSMYAQSLNNLYVIRNLAQLKFVQRSAESKSNNKKNN